MKSIHVTRVIKATVTVLTENVELTVDDIESLIDCGDIYIGGFDGKQAFDYRPLSAAIESNEIKVSVRMETEGDVIVCDEREALNG